MRDTASGAFGVVGIVGVFALGLASVVSFSIEMLRLGDLFWLVVGWVAFPITALVWPALAGVDWAVPFYVGLVGAVALLAIGAHLGERAKEERVLRALLAAEPGSPSAPPTTGDAFSTSDAASESGVFVHSEPLPPEANEEAMAEGTGRLIALLEPGPNSPPLRIRATNSALWALNLDGSLYERLTWATVHGAGREENGRWSVDVTGENFLWSILALDPGDDAEAWARILEPLSRHRPPGQA